MPSAALNAGDARRAQALPAQVSVHDARPALAEDEGRRDRRAGAARVRRALVALPDERLPRWRVQRSGPAASTSRNTSPTRAAIRAGIASCIRRLNDPTGENLHRTLLWTIYLNDGFGEGETEFLHQRRKIAPRTGSLLIAPTAFTHTHRGNMPKGGDKYIATSWILFQRAECQLLRRERRHRSNPSAEQFRLRRRGARRSEQRTIECEIARCARGPGAGVAIVKRWRINSANCAFAAHACAETRIVVAAAAHLPHQTQHMFGAFREMQVEPFADRSFSSYGRRSTV